MGDPSQVILFIQRRLLEISIVTIIVAVPVLAPIYYRNRRHPILRARRPEWALFNQILIAITAIAYGHDAWIQYPSCAKILFTNSVFSMLSLDSHIIRSWLLLYNWNVSKALCQQTAGDGENQRSWWLQNTYLASSSTMIKLMAVFTVFHIGCWMLFTGIHGWDQAWHDPVSVPICTGPLLWFFGVWGALACLMVIALYLSYNMRLVVDAFCIRNELMRSGGIWIVGAMPFWFVALILPSVEQNPNFAIMTGLSVVICAIYVLYLNLAVPLLMLARELRQRTSLTLTIVPRSIDGPDGSVHLTTSTAATPSTQGLDHQRKVGLRKMLDTNTGIAGAFIEFLTKEFSVENWKFYSEVQQLRVAYGGWRESHAGRSGLDCGDLDWFKVQGSDIVTLEAKVNQIYAMYLARSAPFEVNLSSDRILALRSCFGLNQTLRPQRIGEIPELLCRAQDEIYDLMRTDSYERFKKTDEYDQAQLALA